MLERFMDRINDISYEYELESDMIYEEIVSILESSDELLFDDYLLEESEDQFSIKDRLVELKNKVIGFFKKNLSKVKSFFSSNGYKKSINNIELKLKSNPKLRQGKIKVKDYKKIDAEYRKTHKEISNLMSKAKRGKVKLSDLEELEKRHKRRIKAAISSTAIVTVGASIVGLKSMQRRYETESATELQRCIDVFDDAIDTLKEDQKYTKDDIQSLIRASKLGSDLAQELTTQKASWIKNLYTNIVGFLRKDSNNEVIYDNHLV